MVATSAPGVFRSLTIRCVQRQGWMSASADSWLERADGSSEIAASARIQTHELASSVLILIGSRGRNWRIPIVSEVVAYAVHSTTSLVEVCRRLPLSSAMWLERPAGASRKGTHGCQSSTSGPARPELPADPAGRRRPRVSRRRRSRRGRPRRWSQRWRRRKLDVRGPPAAPARHQAGRREQD